MYIKYMLHDKILYCVLSHIFCLYGFIHFKAIYALAVLCIISFVD